MANADAITFTRLADGTVLQRHADGAFRPVTPGSDRARLAALTDAEIEAMSVADPDHPGLDDAILDAAAVRSPAREAISIEIDSDVLRYFRGTGRDDYQARINAALRQHMQAGGEAG